MSFHKGAKYQLSLQLKESSQTGRDRGLAPLIQPVKLQRLCPIPSVVLLPPPCIPYLPLFPQAHSELSLVEKKLPIPSYPTHFSVIIIIFPAHSVSPLLWSCGKRRSPPAMPRMGARPGLRGLTAITSRACSQRYLSGFITVTSQPFGNLPKMYLRNYCCRSEEKTAKALL